MMESTVSVNRAIALAAWSIAGLFILIGWTLYLNHYADLAIMVMLSCLPFMATGALLQIRCWASRVCQVVRVCSRPDGNDPRGVVPLR